MHSSQAHHLDLLTRHALATLPDFTRARKRLLALVVALPRDHATRLTAQALLDSVIRPYPGTSGNFRP